MLQSPSTLEGEYVPKIPANQHGYSSAIDLEEDFSQPAHLHRAPTEVREVTVGDFTAGISDKSLSTRRDYLAVPIDLRSRLDAELGDRQMKMGIARRRYWTRIDSLVIDARADGFSVNRDSERDFWAFMRSVSFGGSAEIVLVDNGNLRAVWDGEDGSHLGLQFLGGRMLQFVIFRRRKGSGHISRVAGRETFEGVRKQVRIFDLEVLLST